MKPKREYYIAFVNSLLLKKCAQFTFVQIAAALVVVGSGIAIIFVNNTATLKKA